MPSEEALPEGGKVEVGIGEEEESDFRSWRRGRRGEVGESGAAEEGKIVELVGEGNWDAARREDARGKEEEQREREEECK